MNGKSHLPYSSLPIVLKAVVVLLGLSVYSLLSKDSSITYSLILIASIALASRLTGLLEKPWAKLQLSILATVCLALYLVHGYGNHFDILSFPIVIATTALLAYFLGISISLPRVRLLALSIGLLAYIALLRNWYPGILSTFESEAYSWVLFLLAWESLLSSIHSSRPGPTISETATALGFVFFHYHFHNLIVLDTAFTLSIILSFFLGRIVLHNRLPFTRRNARGLLLRGPFSRGIASSYAILSLATILLTAGSAWLLYSNSKQLPWFDSLRIPRSPIAFEQKQTNSEFDPEFSSSNPSQKAYPNHGTNALELPNYNLNEPHRPENPTNQTQKKRPKIIVKIKDTSSKGYTEFNGFDLETTPATSFDTTSSPVIRQTPIPSISQSSIFDPGEDTTNSEKMTAPANSLDLLDFSLDEFSVSSQKPGETTSASGETQSSDRTGNFDSINSRPEYRLGGSNSISNNPKTIASANSDSIRSTIGPSGTIKYANNVSLTFDLSALMEVFLSETETAPKSLYLRLKTLEQLGSDKFGNGNYNNQFDVSITGPNWMEAPVHFRSNVPHEKTWTFAIIKDWSGELPIPNYFEKIQVSNTASLLVNTQHRSLRTAQPTAPFAYRLRGVSDIQPVEDSTKYSHIDNLTAPLAKREIDYLETLSRKIGSRAKSRMAFASEVENYLSQNHPYQFDFSVRNGQEHVLIRWLKTKSPGICGYYAGAFVLLARSQGIPARVVTGLHTSEYNPNKHSFTVRRRDAHAWVEYQDENNKWVRVDPTPSAKESPRYTSSKQTTTGYSPKIESLLAQFQFADPIEPRTAKAESIPQPDSTPALASSYSGPPIYEPTVVSILNTPNTISGVFPELNVETSNVQQKATVVQSSPTKTTIELLPNEATAKTVSELALEQTETPSPIEKTANLSNFNFKPMSWFLEYSAPILILLISSIRLTFHLKTNRTKSRATIGRSKLALRAQSKIDRILVQLDTLTAQTNVEPTDDLLQARSLALGLRYGPQVDTSFFKKTLKQLNTIIRASTRN
jgi:transglutaminase-like putative cysteine protease